MRALIGLIPLLVACGPSTPFPAETAAKAVTDGFAAANPAGRTGVLLKGKAVWLEAPYFDKGCLEGKDLAFNDNAAKRPGGDAGAARISPTYDNQRFLTASTPTGYCVYIGDDPQISVDPTQVQWLMDHYAVPAMVSMGKPNPWFDCMADSVKKPVFEVYDDGTGNPRVEGKLAMVDGDCPHPLPGGEERAGRAAPTGKADKAPTRDQVISLARSFDDKLYEGDFAGALDMVSCYNLFSDPPYGACSAGELISVGPAARGQPRPQDGTPWLEYAIADFDDIGAIKADRKDPSMFHVSVKHKRTGTQRSFAVQEVGGQWKLVGVIGRKAESLTSVRFVYDLDRPEVRSVFDRRMKGEPIDEKGNPLDPYAELDE